MAVLSEQGLYFFLGRSDKPKALPFQRWIAGEVAATIRTQYCMAAARTPAPAVLSMELLPHEQLVKGDLPSASLIRNEESQAFPFDFQGNPVRTIVDEKGNPWFVAKDVCVILGYSNGPDAVRSSCKSPKLLKCTGSVVLKIPPRGMLIVNEPDLYRLITRSTLPACDSRQGHLWSMLIRTLFYAPQNIAHTGFHRHRKTPLKTFCTAKRPALHH
jgi:prophage antirepressor-like protein